jgi:hypothetical protein
VSHGQLVFELTFPSTLLTHCQLTMSTPGGSLAIEDLFSGSHSPSPAPEPFNDTDSPNSDVTKPVGVNNASPQEPTTRQNSVELENNVLSHISSTGSCFFPELSQYCPTLKRKASQDLSHFAEEKACLYGLPENDVTEVASQFAHVSHCSTLIHSLTVNFQYSTDQKLIMLCIRQKW